MDDAPNLNPPCSAARVRRGFLAHLVVYLLVTGASMMLETEWLPGSTAGVTLVLALCWGTGLLLHGVAAVGATQARSAGRGPAALSSGGAGVLRLSLHH